MNFFSKIALFSLFCLLLSGCSLPKDSVADFVDTAKQVQESTDSADTLDQANDVVSKLDQASELLKIVDKKWQLIELNGVALESDNPPHFTLSSDLQINGFAGCNNFFGSFKYKQPLGLKFSDLGSTMMFCPDSSQLETDFLALFAQIDNFSLNQEANELSLNKARMAPLARFALVE
jgi:heat shock protein HslJ